MYNVNEQRTYPRISVDCELTYTPVGGTRSEKGTAKNISANGVFFIASEEIAVGTILDIHVTPGTESIPPLKAIIEVIRTTPADTEGRHQIAGLIKTLK